MASTEIDIKKFTVQPPKNLRNIIIYCSLCIVAIVWDSMLAAEFRAVELNQGYYKIVFSEPGARPTYEPTHIKPKDWVHLSQISRAAVHAFIVSEDNRFYEHGGIDLKEMMSSLEDTIVHKKRLRGASTISQQAIKNLYLSHDRNYLRKFKELVMVQEIERQVTKDKILESYLNVIEFGDGIYGIKQAAKTYFKKHPSRLSAKEGAFLAMLLPSPKRYSESWRKGRLTPYASKTINRILKRLYNSKILSHKAYTASLRESFSWE